MFKLTPKTIARSGSVDRWQIVRTARKQTLAEHSFMVAMYSLILADKLGISENKRYNMVLHALHHDLSEIFTGDISSVAKDLIRSGSKHSDADPLECLDQVLPVACNIKTRSSPEAIAIVKMADYIDAITFLHVERLSNHGKEVIKKLKGKSKHYCQQLESAMPNYQWSIAFAEVLEEAMHGEDLAL